MTENPCLALNIDSRDFPSRCDKERGHEGNHRSATWGYGVPTMRVEPYEWSA